MKKLFAFILVLFSLTACQRFQTPTASPVATRETTEETPITTENSHQIYSNEDYGIFFEYPADWILSAAPEGGDHWRVDVYNIPPSDGPSCTEPLVFIAFVLGWEKDPAQDFSEFAHSPEIYNEEPGLGHLGGNLVETTIADKPAFRADSSGWENYCPGAAYIVEQAPDKYAMIVTSVNIKSPDVFEIGAILDSLELD